jgi:hypothetical protein
MAKIRFTNQQCNRINIVVLHYTFKKSIRLSDTPPSSVMDSVASPKVKTMEGEGVRACSLACNTLGVEGCVGAPKWGLGRLTSNSITHTDLHKPNNELISA